MQRACTEYDYSAWRRLATQNDTHSANIGHQQFEVTLQKKTPSLYYYRGRPAVPIYTITSVCIDLFIPIYLYSNLYILSLYYIYIYRIRYRAPYRSQTSHP